MICGAAAATAAPSSCIWLPVAQAIVVNKARERNVMM
jgi:hypothetical protein